MEALFEKFLANIKDGKYKGNSEFLEAAESLYDAYLEYREIWNQEENQLIKEIQRLS